MGNNIIRSYASASKGQLMKAIFNNGCHAASGTCAINTKNKGHIYDNIHIINSIYISCFELFFLLIVFIVIVNVKAL